VCEAIVRTLRLHYVTTDRSLSPDVIHSIVACHVGVQYSIAEKHDLWVELVCWFNNCDNLCCHHMAIINI
jgi:hypothetical protein